MILEYVKQKFVAFKESEWKWTRIFIAILFIGNFLIPAYHSFTAQIPPAKELLKAEGKLFFQPVPGKGSLTGLKTINGEVMFTCEDTFFDDKDCVWDEKIERAIQGKVATAYWFRQPSYLWMQRDRLVELWVGSDSTISRAQTQRKIDNNKDTFMWLVPISFLGCFVLDAYVRRVDRMFKRNKKQDD
jgi:hypothetical protein